MQNRGLIKFFAILFALVSIYQLSFTFVSHKIESDAKSYANGNSEKELKYLDSIGKEKVFNLGFSDFTYNEVKDKKINKGLDLEGGINVQLQISVKDIIKGLSNNSKNPVFNQALAEATKNRQGNQDYLDVFFAEFEKAADGKIKLSSPDVFANKILGDEVNFKKTDDEVKKVIRRKVDESIESAFEVLRKRIDKFGVTQPNIQKLGESGRILVELPGAKDVDRIKKLLQSTAQLEFWETYKIDELGNFLMATNNALKLTEKGGIKVKETAKTGIDTLLTDKAKDTVADKKGSNPLLDKFVSQGGGPVLGVVAPKDTAVINSYFKRQDIRVLLPSDKRYAKFVWGKPSTIIDEKTKINTNNVIWALEIDIAKDYINSTKDSKEKREAINDIEWQKKLVNIAQKNWKQQLEVREKIIDSLSNEITSLTLDLLNKTEELKKVGKKENSYIFPPFKVENYDFTEFNITITDKTDITKPTETEFNFPFKNKGGFKLDFSTGILATGLYSPSYKLYTIGSKAQIKEEANPTSKFNTGIALMAHAYTRTGKYINLGVGSGFSYNLNSQNLNYLLGGSLLWGEEQRFITTIGLNIGKVKELSNYYEVNKEYDSTEFTPNAEVPTVDVLKASWFLSITYNLGIGSPTKTKKL